MFPGDHTEVAVRPRFGSLCKHIFLTNPYLHIRYRLPESFLNLRCGKLEIIR